MTIIYFILILGITVLIHELGHFIFAKRAGIYVYEFSIGMGPVIKKWKSKKDETEYAIRLLPIGGAVSLAGESVEEDKSIPKNKLLQNKTWMQRFWTIIAGILFNFLLAIVVFFIGALISGATKPNAYISFIDEDLPAFNSSLKAGDEVLKLNGKKVNADIFLLKLMVNKNKEATFTVKHEDGNIEEIKITPTKIDDSYRFGFGIKVETEKGFLVSLKYAFTKFWSLIVQMSHIICYLFTGAIGLSSLSGPVGIFNVIGETAKAGETVIGVFTNLLFLLGYISLNVGFVNLLPIPAFDGGRLLFLLIEKIKGSPVSTKIENTIHTVGLFLLLGLMVLVTYNDIVRLIVKK